MAIGINSPTAVGVATPVSIEFDAPADCSSVDAFYQGVSVRTDRVRPAAAGEAAVQIRVRLYRVGTTVRGELKFGDQQGESETRRVDGLSCNEVVEALSLTAALALDPSASLLSGMNGNESSTPGAIDLTHNVAAVPAPATAKAELVPSQFDSSHQSNPEFGKGLDIFVRVLIASYVAPGFETGAAVGARLMFPLRRTLRASVGLQAFHVANDMLQSAESSTFRLTGVAMTLCPVHHAPVHWVELAACGFAAGGRLEARGLGVSNPQSVGRSWWTVGVSGLTSVQLSGPWRFELTAGIAIPIVRREFVTGPPDRDVGGTPIVSPQGALGFAYRF